MSKKTKAPLEDYEPLTETGKKAKEQLIELLSRRYSNRLSRYCCPYSEDQIIEMWQHSKQTVKNRQEKQEIKYEDKIQSEKANA
jgi:DNA invertase Pin-like site-specific DNA recombinase